MKLVNVVNRKICCGVVRVGAPLLHPGDGTDVEVSLLVGGRFGGVVHETEVVTDLPTETSVILRTTAQAVLPVRVEADSTAGQTILVGTKENRRAEFRVYASGLSTEPSVDLDRVELRSTIPVDWLSPKESSPADDGLRVESRRFAITLDPIGPPGERRAEILLQDGERVVYRHVVSWEIISRITVSPKVIAMRSGQRDYQVVIQSRDQRPFRIRRIECNLPGLEGRASAVGAALMHVVQVEGFPQSKNRRGDLTVLTDHPLQEKVELPIVVID